MSAGISFGDYAQDYNTAIYFYKRGEHELAAKTIEELVSHYPAEKRLDAALYWGAQSYERLGKPREALRMYRRIVSDFPESAYRIDALSAAGQSASDAGEYQEALALFGAAAQSGAEGRSLANFQVKISETLLKLGNDAEAERSLLELMRNPHLPRDRRAEAELRYRQLLARTGRGAQSRAAFARVPKNSEFYQAEEWMYRGDAAFAAGKIGESRSWYEQVYRKAAVPADFRAQALYNSARASLMIGDEENAMSLFPEVANNKEAYLAIRGSSALELARLYQSAGRTEEAAEMAALGGRIAESIGDAGLKESLRFFMAESSYRQKRYDETVSRLTEMSESGYRVDRLKAMALMESGRYDEASTLLEQAAVAAPDDEGRNLSYFDLARIHMQSKQYEQAMSDLSRIQRPSKSLEDRMAPMEADLLYQAGRFKDASRVYGRLAAGATDDAPGRRYRYMSALSAFKDKNYSWAEKLQEKLSEIGGIPDGGKSEPAAILDAAMQIDRAVDFSASGRDDVLQKQIDSILERIPDTPLLAFVVESLNAKQRTKILPKYTRLFIDATAADEPMAGRFAFYEMAAYQKEGNAKSARVALDDLTKWIDLHPGTYLAEDAEYWRARLARDMGDLESAREGYRQYVKRYPQGKYAGEAYMQFGNFAMETGSSADAETAFERLLAGRSAAEIAADPTLAKSASDLAAIRRRQRRYTDALELLEPLDAIDRYRSSPDYQFELAEVYQLLGKGPNARARLRNVIDNPGVSQEMTDRAAEMLLTSLYKSNQYSELSADHRRFGGRIKERVAQSKGKYYMGMIHFQASRFREAIPYFEGVRDPSGSDMAVESEVRLADCAYQLKEYGDALDRYGKILRNHPKSRWAQECFYLSELCKIKLGMTGDALSGYEQFLKQSPDAPQAGDVAFEVAKLYLQAEDLDAAERMLDLVEKKITVSGGLSEEFMRMKIDIYKRRGQHDKLIQLAKRHRSAHGMNVDVAVDAAVAATKTGESADPFDLGASSDVVSVTRVFEEGFSVPKSKPVTYAIDEKFYDRGSRSFDAENTVKCSLKRLIYAKTRVFLIIEARVVSFVSERVGVRLTNVVCGGEELKRMKEAFVTGVQISQEFGLGHGQTKVFVVSMPRQSWSEDMIVTLDIDFASRKLLLACRVKSRKE